MLEDMHFAVIVATAKSCNMPTPTFVVHQEALQLQEILNLLDCSITNVKNLPSLAMVLLFI